MTLFQALMNVAAMLAGVICVLGGFAVLSQCPIASLSWRAMSGIAVTMVGALGMADAAAGAIEGRLALAVICLAVPVSNVLWRAWHHLPVRRITDLAMFDDQPHHHQ